MKKTVTTMLSLALAMILVSSLSSGVILAKGDDDHDNRKKNKNKYKTVTMHDVVILDCGPDEFLALPVPGGLIVAALHSNTGEDFSFILTGFGVVPTTCVDGTIAILEAGFKLVNSSGGFNPALVDFAGTGSGFPGSEALFTRFTFLKTTKMRVPREDD